MNKVEISKSLEKEEIKLRTMQTENVSKSARGDNGRLEFWNTLLPQIRKALKEVINDVNKNNKRQGAHIFGVLRACFNPEQMYPTLKKHFHFTNLENDDEDDDDNDSDAEDIDPNTAFEHVRQLMLKEKILEAVTYLWKACIALKQCPDMENLSPDAKEEFLFLLLLKTFMESEDTSNQAKEGTDKTRESTVEAQSGDKEKEEIAVVKRVVNYLRVGIQTRFIKCSLSFWHRLVAYVSFFLRIVWNSQPS